MRVVLIIGLAAVAACNAAAAATERPIGTGPATTHPAPRPPAPAVKRPGLVINEVAAAGRPDDWFELINTSDRSIDLSDFVFVDRRGELARARSFPGFVLRPGERHVQRVDGAVAGFQLGKAESLWIYRAADGVLVDGVDWSEGDSPRLGSYARVPDATGGFVTRARDTQDAPNG